MVESYKPLLREIITPVWGDFMYRNRTLYNPNFIASVDETTIRKAKMVDKVLKCYAFTGAFLVGFLIRGGGKSIERLLNH